MLSFKGYNIDPRISSVLESQGISVPSAVQGSVIPKALRGESLLAQSPTGSGKTHSFLIPIFQQKIASFDYRAVIVSPTAELARQIYSFAQPLATALDVSLKLFTAENEREEGKFLHPDVTVSTPGRLLDMLRSGMLSPRSVRTIVLDEADMLLDMGFFDEVAEIMDYFKDPQVLVFSATLKEHLKSSLAKFVKASFNYEGGKEKTGSGVSHHLVDVRHADRAAAAARLISILRPYLSIVFVNKKEEAGAVYEALKRENLKAVVYTGDLSERERKKTMRLIREDRYEVIVASDLLSRGIDLPSVDCVISTDLPFDLDFYYHRAGRTGRFLAKGDSYVFYDNGEEAKAKALVDAGVPFDFMVLRKDGLRSDPVGLAPKKKLNRGKKYGEDEKREIDIVKARTNSKDVKPGYKRKQKLAVEKVKRKYRRKAIQKAIRKNLAKKGKSDE